MYLTRERGWRPVKTQEKIYFPGSRLAEGIELEIIRVSRAELEVIKKSQIKGTLGGTYTWLFQAECDVSEHHCPRCCLALSKVEVKRRKCDNCEAEW